jgi:hypothetical protein
MSRPAGGAPNAGSPVLMRQGCLYQPCTGLGAIVECVFHMVERCRRCTHRKMTCRTGGAKMIPKNAPRRLSAPLKQ